MNGDYAEYRCGNCNGRLFARATGSNQNQYARGERGRNTFGDQGRQECADKQCQPVSDEQCQPVSDGGPSYKVDDNPSFPLRAARATAALAVQGADGMVDKLNYFDEVLRPALAWEGHIASFPSNAETALAMLRVEEGRASYSPAAPAASAAPPTEAAHTAATDPPFLQQEEVLSKWEKIEKAKEARARHHANGKKALTESAEAAAAEKSRDESDAQMIDMWRRSPAPPQPPSQPQPQSPPPPPPAPPQQPLPLAQVNPADVDLATLGQQTKWPATAKPPPKGAEGNQWKMQVAKRLEGRRIFIESMKADYMVQEALPEGEFRLFNRNQPESLKPFASNGASWELSVESDAMDLVDGGQSYAHVEAASSSPPQHGSGSGGNGGEGGHSRGKARQLQSPQPAVQPTVALEPLDLKDQTLRAHKKEHVTAVAGYRIEVTGITWDDVVGAEHTRKLLEERVVLPLRSPELFDGVVGGRSKGMLLFGPPGTGKTLTAKAVAAQLGFHFFEVTGGRINSKHTGEAEKLVGALFAVARVAKPGAVVFIDECDSLLCKGTGEQAVDHDKIVNEFKQCWDGISSGSGNVFVIGATNYPWNIESAILREGRMDFKLFVKPPNGKDRLRILEMSFNDDKWQFDGDRHELLRWVARKTEGYTASGLVQGICKEAQMGPVMDAMHESPSKRRPIRQNDFERALNTFQRRDLDIETYEKWSLENGTKF